MPDTALKHQVPATTQQAPKVSSGAASALDILTQSASRYLSTEVQAQTRREQVMSDVGEATKAFTPALNTALERQTDALDKLEAASELPTVARNVMSLFDSDYSVKTQRQRILNSQLRVNQVQALIRAKQTAAKGKLDIIDSSVQAAKSAYEATKERIFAPMEFAAKRGAAAKGENANIRAQIERLPAAEIKSILNDAAKADPNTMDQETRAVLGIAEDVWLKRQQSYDALETAALSQQNARLNIKKSAQSLARGEIGLESDSIDLDTKRQGRIDKLTERGFSQLSVEQQLRLIEGARTDGKGFIELPFGEGEDQEILRLPIAKALTISHDTSKADDAHDKLISGLLTERAEAVANIQESVNIVNFLARQGMSPESNASMQRLGGLQQQLAEIAGKGADVSLQELRTAKNLNEAISTQMGELAEQYAKGYSDKKDVQQALILKMKNPEMPLQPSAAKHVIRESVSSGNLGMFADWARDSVLSVAYKLRDTISMTNIALGPDGKPSAENIEQALIQSLTSKSLPENQIDEFVSLMTRSPETKRAIVNNMRVDYTKAILQNLAKTRGYDDVLEKFIDEDGEFKPGFFPYVNGKVQFSMQKLVKQLVAADVKWEADPQNQGTNRGRVSRTFLMMLRSPDNSNGFVKNTMGNSSIETQIFFEAAMNPNTFSNSMSDYSVQLGSLMLEVEQAIAEAQKNEYELFIDGGGNPDEFQPTSPEDIVEGAFNQQNIDPEAARRAAQPRQDGPRGGGL